MGKEEQAPALAIFVQDSLWVWSETSRGRPPDGGLALALAVFHMVPLGSLLLLISSYILLLISANVLLLASLVSPCASALQLFPVVCTALDVAGEAGATGPP